jgi:hypothetical protein
MKVWNQYGTEHSANLVMIGRFKDITEATKAKELVDQLTDQVTKSQDRGDIVVGSPAEKYDRQMLDFLVRHNIATLGARELEQFLYDVTVMIDNDKVVITTEENDVSAFFKILLGQGARIEIYSAHTHTNTKYGKGQ